jgi:hypothetical protein
MGCTTVNGARRDYALRRLNSVRPTGYKLEVFSDGQATKWMDIAVLADNEIWIDASMFFRQGTNLGPTLSYNGSGSCVVTGSLEDKRAIHQLVNGDPDAQAALVAYMSPQWIEVASLAPGAAEGVDMKIFDIFRLVFTGAGSATIMSI